MDVPSDSPPRLAVLAARLAAVEDAWAGGVRLNASAIRDHPADPAAVDARALSDDGLLRVLDALAGLTRAAEAAASACAAELAARCTGIPGEDPARDRGYPNPARLVADTTRRRAGEAHELIAVGAATALRSSFAGERLAPRLPHLAVGLASAELGLHAAERIRRFLDRVAPRVESATLDEAERFLVEQAASVGPERLAQLITLLEARLDPDGVRPREDELRGRRGLRIWEDTAGMVNVRGAFDPVNGATLKAAVGGLVGAELHRARDARRRQHDDDSGIAEHRSIAQLNADALADLARHALGCAAVPTLRQTTVVVRADAAALLAERGHGTIDGLDQPISIASVRALVSSAGIAPLFVGEHGEPLQLGRSARLFSAAQKLALADRDGGCAWPGCSRPPSHTEAHHIAWWHRDDGRTDLDNGILLCSHHHHRVHDDGWRIVVRDGGRWFIPPPHIDPHGTPIAANTSTDRRMGLLARAMAAA
ncbi:HNH endonuclease signature motif containing protein [Agromyces sp. NBRC 114283]|uniref:HNH endonuclease signature motif containing protein n=1 Tax=Agromyces sp. NBRC 114283 TaxID=2994521 RepID=UPI0024A1D366|nr:HNH endonuclease signature motif containing protein [Agromyces sp. NBRC 114283]GLU90898.1 HNH endonuclease [Agromyces sp. NBRC 114283]